VESQGMTVVDHAMANIDLKKKEISGAELL
jgi:hypothetical protein